MKVFTELIDKISAEREMMKSWYQKDKTFEIGSADSFMETDPDIVQFLAELDLLYHVPCSYLLPDEGMLKDEQICFFYLDSEWLRCMRQGALSIGTGDDAERSWNRQAAAYYETAVKKQAFKVRNVGGLQTERDYPGVRSGFFLRSEAVRCWPGIEVICWEDENVRTEESRLPILRLEKMSGDTLLCIADGEIKAAELSRPPEGIYMEAKKEETAEKIVFREDGVLDVRSMAQALSEKGKASPEEFGALFLHKQKKYLFVPDRVLEKSLD